ncbi:MAG TPA: OmpW family outer membrane protein [Thermoanaerobaculia bacterium]|nr:OmpW family outer membrane protein [Thermoanaerobaculia bacterium]
MRKAIMVAALLTLMGSVDAVSGDFSIIVSGFALDRTGRGLGEEEIQGTTVDFDFDLGGAIGGGLLWQFSRNWAFEGKVAYGRMETRVRRRVGDAIAVLILDDVEIIPVTAVLQWRPDFSGDWDPYLGVGVAHFEFRDLRLGGNDRISFDNDTGLVLAAGLDIAISERWFINGDVKYVPFETGSEGISVFGVQEELEFEPILVSVGIRYQF